MKPAMKIFQIGFNKCGTSSLSEFFESSGFSCVHWDEGRLALRMKRNIEENKFVIAGYEDYDFFSDMEHSTNEESIEAYKYFPTILDQVEGARFILNTRNKQAWIKSRINHPTYLEYFKLNHRLEADADVIDLWSRDWDDHHQAVQELIPSERLLVFNIETDSPVRLC